MSITLEIPSLAHKKACEEMIAEWMRFGGEIHPGLLRRYSERQGVVRYEQWLEQLVETEDEQQLYFLMQEQRMLGAIALRPHEQGESLLVNGHCGYGIRPSERRKGYAVQMLWLALPLLRGKGVCTAVITCDRNNLASASTILRCKGIEAGEILDPDTGGIKRIFKICLSDG